MPVYMYNTPSTYFYHFIHDIQCYGGWIYLLFLQSVVTEKDKTESPQLSFRWTQCMPNITFVSSHLFIVVVRSRERGYMRGNWLWVAPLLQFLPTKYASQKQICPFLLKCVLDFLATLFFESNKHPACLASLRLHIVVGVYGGGGVCVFYIIAFLLSYSSVFPVGF